MQEVAEWVAVEPLQEWGGLNSVVWEARWLGGWAWVGGACSLTHTARWHNRHSWPGNNCFASACLLPHSQLEGLIKGARVENRRRGALGIKINIHLCAHRLRTSDDEWDIFSILYTSAGFSRKLYPSRCLEVALGNERFPINYLHSVVPRNASDRYNWKEHIKYDSGNLTVNSSRGCRGSYSIDRGNQRNDAFPGQSIALDDWGLYNAEVTEVTMLYLWLPTGNYQPTNVRINIHAHSLSGPHPFLGIGDWRSCRVWPKTARFLPVMCLLFGLWPLTSDCFWQLRIRARVDWHNSTDRLDLNLSFCDGLNVMEWNGLEKLCPCWPFVAYRFRRNVNRNSGEMSFNRRCRSGGGTSFACGRGRARHLPWPFYGFISI